jgi:hypothetical protein
MKSKRWSASKKSIKKVQQLTRMFSFPTGVTGVTGVGSDTPPERLLKGRSGYDNWNEGGIWDRERGCCEPEGKAEAMHIENRCEERNLEAIISSLRSC